MLKIGDKAPDFTLKSDEGKDVSLKDFKGKRVILFFFPKANTPG
jgi:peroxiredoxin Q/BCP